MRRSPSSTVRSTCGVPAPSKDMSSGPLNSGVRLDAFSRIQAVNETAAHLEVLLVRGQVTRETSSVGADLYQLAAGQR